MRILLTLCVSCFAAQLAASNDCSNARILDTGTVGMLDLYTIAGGQLAISSLAN